MGTNGGLWSASPRGTTFSQIGVKGVLKHRFEGLATCVHILILDIIFAIDGIDAAGSDVLWWGLGRLRTRAEEFWNFDIKIRFGFIEFPRLLANQRGRGRRDELKVSRQKWIGKK